MASLRGAILAVELAQWATAGDSARIFSRTLGGSSGITTINTIATDSSGNVIVAGTTSAFDFPVANGSINSGTAIAKSFDSGKTWRPLGNLPAASTHVLARDASTPSVFFAGGRGGVFRSNDAGKTWVLSASPAQLNCGNPICGLNAVTADLVHPGTVYAGGIFGIRKTTDGRASGQPAQTGITVPTGPGISFVAIDPFHPNVVYTEAGSLEYRSSDGGNSGRSTRCLISIQSSAISLT